MAESLFRVFDEDKSGTLSFEEYFQASQVGRLDNQHCLIIFTNSWTREMSGVGPWECRGQTVVDLHGFRLGRRRFHRLRRDHRHLPGPVQTGRDPGGRGYAGLLRGGRQVRTNVRGAGILNYHCLDPPLTGTGMETYPRRSLLRTGCRANLSRIF